MKKVLLALPLLVWSCFAFGTIRTVNKTPGAAGQYADLQTAIDASAPFDTLYVHAAPTAYPGVTVVRPIVIFGEGALPDQQNHFRTEIGAINFFYSFDFSTNASGSKLYGCKVFTVDIGGGNLGCNCSSVWNACGTIGLSNIHIERNEIQFLRFTNNMLNPPYYGCSYAHQTGISLINNIIYEFFGQMMSNCFFSNNIIRDCWGGGGAGISFDNVFANNVVLGSNFNLVGTQVINNLFHIYPYYQYGEIYVGGYQNIYNHNVSKGVMSFCAGCEGSFGVNSWNVGNQIVAETNWGSSSGQVWVSNYTENNSFPNFHLVPGSVGQNYGTDGTDVGIYGGAFPWTDYTSNPDVRYLYYAPPKQLPVLQQLDVLTPFVSPAGQINIQFKAKSQN